MAATTQPNPYGPDAHDIRELALDNVEALAQELGTTGARLAQISTLDDATINAALLANNDEVDDFLDAYMTGTIDTLLGQLDTHQPVTDDTTKDH